MCYKSSNCYKEELLPVCRCLTNSLTNPNQIHSTMNTNKILVLLSFVLFSPLISHSAVYIKIDGIDGEARDKNHKGWIDLTSVSTRSGEHNGWSDLQSFSQGLSQNNSGQGIVHRDLAARNTRTPRDSASGLPIGRRDAASAMATGKRQQ